MDMPASVSVPLRTDKDGVIRVGNTRVILDLVIYGFRQGATPETIVDQYPSLSLGDVYVVLGYYLQNREEVDTYIRQREVEGEAIRRENEARFPSEGIRARLLARLEAKKQQS